MVDFHTQCRQRGFVFYPVEKRKPATSYRDVYRQTAPEVFKTPRVQGTGMLRVIQIDRKTTKSKNIYMVGGPLSYVGNISKVRYKIYVQ